jgi:hypothetical protein
MQFLETVSTLLGLIAAVLSIGTELSRRMRPRPHQENDEES